MTIAMQDSLWRLRVLKSFPVCLDQLCQPLVALGNLEADLGLRIVLGQQCGSLPPCLSALAVNSGVPIFWHAFAFLQPDGRFDVLECMTGDEARARAAHYRQLARQMTDGVARDELFKLAAEYVRWSRDCPVLSAPAVPPTLAEATRMWRRMPKNPLKTRHKRG